MIDLVERLRVNAKSWRRKDAFMARDQEEEARFNDEAADEIERLQRELAEARRQVFIEAAEIAMDRYRDAEFPDFDGGYASAQENIAEALRAKAEGET